MGDTVNNKIAAIVGTQDPSFEREKQTARVLVNELFREKTMRQRGLLLDIAEKKIAAMTKIVSAAETVTDSIVEEMGDLEFYSLDEKVKILRDLVRSGAILSASTEMIRNLADSLNDFKNSLDDRGSLSEKSKASIELLLARIKFSIGE